MKTKINITTIKGDVHKASDTLIMVSLFIISLLYNFPITNLLPAIIRKPLLILSFLLFVLALLFKNRKYFTILCVSIFVVLVYYINSWVAQDIDFTSYMFPALVSLEALVSVFMILDNSICLNNKLLKFILFSLLITSITSFLGLMVSPYAIERLGAKREGEDFLKYVYYGRNIAGWSLLFGIAFCEGSILYLYRRTKNKLFLIVLGINFLFVLKAQIAFAIIFSLIAIVLVSIIGNRRRLQIRLSLLLVVGTVLWFLKGPILLAAYRALDGKNMARLQRRITNVYDLLVKGESNGDAQTRYELYTKSLNTFIQHPFGLWKSDNIQSRLGFHSEICDIVGALGLFGIMLIIGLLYMFLIRIKLIQDIYTKQFYTVMVFLFFLFACVNPVIFHAHIWINSLLVPALAISYVQYKKR